MSPNVTLHYFKLRGRGELPRLLLEAGGIEYDEVSFGFEEWPAKKASYPFGVVPVLYWDGEEISQSMAITRFIAKKAGLAGANEVEFARADTVAENVIDLFVKISQFRSNPDEAAKKEAGKKIVNELIPNFCKQNEAFVAKQGGKFVNGKSLSFGDIAVFNLFSNLRNGTEMNTRGFSAADQTTIKKTIEGSEKLMNVVNMVQANPKVAAYMKNRVSNDYPF